MARHGVFRKQDLVRAFLVRSRPGGVPCRVAAFSGDLLVLSRMTCHVVMQAEGSEREVAAGGVPCRDAGGLLRREKRPGGGFDVVSCRLFACRV